MDHLGVPKVSMKDVPINIGDHSHMPKQTTHFPVLPSNVNETGWINRQKPTYGMDAQTIQERDMYRRQEENHHSPGAAEDHSKTSMAPMNMKPMAKHPTATKGPHKYAGDSPYND